MFTNNRQTNKHADMTEDIAALHRVSNETLIQLYEAYTDINEGQLMEA